MQGHARKHAPRVPSPSTGARGTHGSGTGAVVLVPALLLAAAIPRMELPPLSPGIQASVMDDAEVLETVRRGWSGGTGEEGKAHEHLACTG